MKEIEKVLNDVLIERSDEIRMLLIGVLCSENPLLVGPPGTAKSMLIDSFSKLMAGDFKVFSILLTKFSTPEDLFGPLSIQGLKEGKYFRITTGKLPEANIAFIDEIFKASPAILNTLLKILNERTFDTGEKIIKCPLLVAMAASNEWPAAEELGALFDRFLLRKTVYPLTRLGLKQLLSRKEFSIDSDTKITITQLKEARRKASSVAFSDDMIEFYESLIIECRKNGIFPSDRRIRKTLQVIKANACLNGRDEVTPEDMEICKFCLWNDPAQEAECHKLIQSKTNPTSLEISAIVSKAITALDMEPEKAISVLKECQEKLERHKHILYAKKSQDWITQALKQAYKKYIGVR
ncbi:MAG: hypothetical protein KatS3mg087_1157 [Patescibacteria group bacterium]|nr:MAG: hypothetical protein KatS3mg087_1157 [Patescibacteria group bacterium]